MVQCHSVISRPRKVSSDSHPLSCVSFSPNLTRKFAADSSHLKKTGRAQTHPFYARVFRGDLSWGVAIGKTNRDKMASWHFRNTSPYNFFQTISSNKNYYLYCLPRPLAAAQLIKGKHSTFPPATNTTDNKKQSKQTSVS